MYVKLPPIVGFPVAVALPANVTEAGGPVLTEMYDMLSAFPAATPLPALTPLEAGGKAIGRSKSNVIKVATGTLTVTEKCIVTVFPITIIVEEGADVKLSPPGFEIVCAKVPSKILGAAGAGTATAWFTFFERTKETV